MSYETNPYYSPDGLDLTPIAEIDYSSGSYEFDIRAVWRHNQTGFLFTARDSGCSCPTPFESFDSLASLERVVDTKELEAEVRAETSSEYSYTPLSVGLDFIKKVREAL